MGLDIQNIRIGFATNSSSTHSIVVLDNAKDQLVNENTKEFGWEYFTCASQNTKSNYIKSMIIPSILDDRSIPNSYKPSIIRALFGDHAFVEDYENAVYNNCETVEDYKEASVDHESVFVFPKERNSNLPNKQFFEEFNNFIVESENIVILGGNDNDEKTHELLDEKKEIDIPLPKDERTHLIARKDEENNFWVIYNPKTGAKIRFRLEIDSLLKNEKITSTSKPELVDVKITDFCPYNCPFCYQDSTLKGKHSSIKNYAIVNFLSKMDVLEVAYGGGEPTLYPDFVNLLKETKEAGITPNFTTRNYKLLNDPDIKEAIKNYVGSFAVSFTKMKNLFNSLDDLERLYYQAKLSNIENKITVQIVMGTLGQIEFEFVLEKCFKLGLPVTLLGYKTVGRGNEYDASSYDWWLSSVQKVIDDLKDTGLYFSASIGIDTVMVQQFQDMLEKSEIPDKLYYNSEGSFSMYADFVKMKFGASSFCPEDEMIDFDLKYGSYYFPDDMVEQVLKCFPNFNNKQE